MAKPVRCARCGRENDPTFSYCLDCGQSLRAGPPVPPERPCAGCGARLSPGFRFCGHCGRPVDTPVLEGPGSAPGTAPKPAPLAGGTELRGAGQAPSEPSRTAGPGPKGGPHLSLLRHDGQPGAVFPLTGEVTFCGRSSGEALLADDPTVSPRHARFTVHDERVTVEDLGSVSGTFVRLHAPHPLAMGDEIRLGRQLLRLEPFPRAAARASGSVPWGSPDRGYELRLSQLLEGGGVGEVFPLKKGENLIGRETGDVTFPFDRYVSGRHARIDVIEGRITLTDLGSSNGTFIRITGPLVLEPGDQLLIGAQLIRLDA
jgi:pSer/pThr/pTyr-binding forkhead associated (FHA) protein